jgi:hypothetical protein
MNLNSSNFWHITYFTIIFVNKFIEELRSTVDADLTLSDFGDHINDKLGDNIALKYFETDTMFNLKIERTTSPKLWIRKSMARCKLTH